MAFTGSPTKSTEYTNQVDGNKKAAPFHDKPVRYAPFSYTHAAGAGIGEVNLVRLLPGRIVVLPDLSRLVTSAFAANADIHIGTRAFTNPDGTAVAEDDNRFADNEDAGGGALDKAFPLPAGGKETLDSRDGVIVYAMIDTGNIEDNDTIDGYVAYVSGN